MINKIVNNKYIIKIFECNKLNRSKLDIYVNKLNSVIIAE